MKNKSNHTSREIKEHKHDWQLLSYGSRGGYVGTLEDMVVLMVCRDCNKVIEVKVENPKLLKKGKER